MAQLSMVLYAKDRVANEFAEWQRQHRTKRGDPATPTPEDLFAFDQMSYMGAEGLDNALALSSVPQGARVLDVGAGYGGPARYLAHTHQCNLTALELQEHVHMLAASLTKLVGLQDRVHHVLGDCVAMAKLPREELLQEYGEHDLVICSLVILHLRAEDRVKAFTTMHKLLRPGGSLFITDFYVRDRVSDELINWSAAEAQPKQNTGLSESDASQLQNIISCPFVPTRREYEDAVREAGFGDVRLSDVSNSWTQFTSERANRWHENQERHIRVHGKELFGELGLFYETMAQLFSNGRLGGAIITAVKPFVQR